MLWDRGQGNAWAFKTSIMAGRVAFDKCFNLSEPQLFYIMERSMNRQLGKCQIL